MWSPSWRLPLRLPQHSTQHRYRMTYIRPVCKICIHNIAGSNNISWDHTPVCLIDAIRIDCGSCLIGIFLLDRNLHQHVHALEAFLSTEAVLMLRVTSVVNKGVSTYRTTTGQPCACYMFSSCVLDYLQVQRMHKAKDLNRMWNTIHRHWVAMWLKLPSFNTQVLRLQNACCRCCATTIPFACCSNLWQCNGTRETEREWHTM